MNILITICARAGSKRLPGKSVKLFHGRPLIEWTYRCALEFVEKWNADIVICSDIPDLSNIDAFSDRQILQRPQHLCGDDVPKLDVIRYVLETVEKSPCCDGIDCVIDLDVTNPCRKPGDVEKALRTFQEEWPVTPVVFSVTSARKNPYYNQVEYNQDEHSVAVRSNYKDDGFFVVKKKKRTRGFFEVTWDMNASILIMKSDWVRNPKNIHPACQGSSIYVMEDWQAFDIDTETDFQIAELMFWKHLLSKGIWEHLSAVGSMGFYRKNAHGDYDYIDRYGALFVAR